MEDLDGPAGPAVAPSSPWMTNLDSLSVSDLEDYIRRLEQEIGRVRAVIAARQGVRRTAESLFNL